MEIHVKKADEVMKNDEILFKEAITVNEVLHKDGSVYLCGTNKEGFVYYARLFDLDGEQKLDLLDIRRGK